jgi:hypothetical protein
MPLRFRFAPAGAVLALLAVLAAGCSESGSPFGPGGAFNQEDADDAAVQASISLAGLQSTLDATSTVGTSTAGDTTWTQGALTFRLTRRWFNGLGVEQTLPDATTDSIHVTTRVFGSDSTAHYAVTVGHSGWLGIGGVWPARDVLWIDASRADTLNTRFTALTGSATRYFEAKTLTTVQDVLWVEPTTTTYPSAGSITMVIAARRFTTAARTTVDRTFNSVVVVEFDGTRYAHATVNGTFHYLIDLETGAVTRDVH